MDDLSFVSWFRVVLIAMTLIVIVVLLVQGVRAWKHLAIGQKLWFTGTVFALLYISDAAREALSVGLEFRWRLVFWVFSMVAFFAYLLEPARSRMKHWGSEPLSTPEAGEAVDHPGDNPVDDA